jgi:glycosyltransferase involved in cell wall biosynthesis
VEAAVEEQVKKPGALSDSSLHLIALPHTQISPEFCGCAYTSKILKFCKMMGKHYRILLYAPEGPEVIGAELIPCLSNETRLGLFGIDNPHNLPFWPKDEDALWFNQNVIKKLRARIKSRDIILATAGWTHKMIIDACPEHLICEPGVGYQGIATRFRAFESYAWMHHIYAKNAIQDGHWFDCVIPNFFDPAELHPVNNPKKDYLLFLGRLIARKGPHIASQVAKACDMPLIVAGPGGKQEGDKIVAEEVTIERAKYVGPVNIAQRQELLANARALVVPTTYIEPFGGVAVESMMCGTPVLATDWGAFTETVLNGVSGYRFRTLGQARGAMKRIDQLDRGKIVKYAISRYSMIAVAPMFQQWFKRLDTLWEKGWYH